MTSMFGGSSPAGSTTVTTNSTSSPTAQGQQEINKTTGGANAIYGQDPYASLNAGQVAPASPYFTDPLQQAYTVGAGIAPSELTNLTNNEWQGIGNLQSGGGGGYAGGAYQAGLSGAADLSYGGGGGQTGGAYNTALNGIAGLASGGNVGAASNTFGAANANLTNTINGAYLNPSSNPGLQSVISQGLASAVPAAQASFTGGNRNDSGLAGLAQATAADNTAGNITYQNYAQERQNQLSADQQANTALLGQQGVQATGAGLGLQGQSVQNSAIATGAGLGLQGQQLQNNTTATGEQLANQLYGTGLAGLSAAGSAGSTLQGYNQAVTNAGVAQQNQNTLAPTQNLQALLSAISGSGALNFGTNVGSQSNPYFQNQGANVLGGISGLAGIGNIGSQLAGYSGLAGSGGLLGSLFGASGAAGGAASGISALGLPALLAF